MGGSSQTIGFHYLFSLLIGLGRGPIDEVVEIKAGDLSAWSGSVTDETPTAINSPDLFGGEKKEGGVQGVFRLLTGAATQILPGAATIAVGGSGPVPTGILPDIKSSIPGISELRGVACLWFDGLVASLNPYPKTWAVRVRRAIKGWHNDDPWYPEKAIISLSGDAIRAANGAHIIYECMTNPEWSRGLPRAALDDASFRKGADTLHDEGFGLCLKWTKPGQISEFIQIVLDHIGGALYTDRQTGLQTLRLLRADYNPDELPLFDENSGLLEIIEDDSAASQTLYSEVIVTGLDPITNKEISVRAHNVAAFQAQGSISTSKVSYPGLPTKELCARVAERELSLSAGDLKRYKIKLDRRAWRIAPGMPFRISCLRRGLLNVVLRAGTVEDTPITNGAITITAIQDVFGLGITSVVKPTPSTWVSPLTTPIPAPSVRLVEAGYRDLLLQIGSGNLGAVDPTDGYIGQLALSPNPTIYLYDLITKAFGEPSYGTAHSGTFTGGGTLHSAVTALATSFVLDGVTGLSDAMIGQALLVGNEIVRLDAYNAVTTTATVARGAADTIPQAHAAGTRMWTQDDDLVGDGRAYAVGETVYSKVLTRTASAVLDPADAAENNITLVGRQALPYPPGAVKVDGDSIYTLATSAYGEIEITWAHRNRITQADQLIGHTESSVLPEDGTTYTVVIRHSGSVLRTESGITGDSWTYTSAMQAADFIPGSVDVELYSVRDGMESYQSYIFHVNL